MADPVVAQPFPYKAEVVEGKTYKWCACGRSSAQPFCDGAHVGTGIEPVDFVATASEKTAFCGCKSSKAGPICDGSHSQ
jgi:CDGSH iron-sulfur domain-containing protein 3